MPGSSSPPSSVQPGWVELIGADVAAGVVVTSKQELIQWLHRSVEIGISLPLISRLHIP